MGRVTRSFRQRLKEERDRERIVYMDRSVDNRREIDELRRRLNKR